MTATLTQITKKKYIKRGAGEGGEGGKTKCVSTICDVVTNKCKDCPCSLYVKMMFPAHLCF